MKKIEQISSIKKYLLFFSIITLLFSCSKDYSEINVNLDEFESINEPYPYHNLTTHNTVDYWELIYSHGFESEEIVFNSGIKCQNATIQDDCVLQFDSTINEIGGFAGGCLPGYCFLYIKYQSADDISLVTNTTGVKDFIGEIDTQADAILFTISQGYNFSTENKETGAIKKTAIGYELLVTKLVADCSPIQTNRFLLAISTEGSITILQEEEYSSSDACI